ncbi:hypothetical protein A3758_12380 [Oleiphilus sp. HI0118]|uniref:disulfide bond formation protein B n=1 Tax=Oleiphilus sp. HI0079 TaxID=1822254 RepID=UPI0007C34F9C|nr:disulfide bond formation protein B [Oleiphilus sp. HI0079]KZZ16821.1 hypothetical protein A3750_10150 [Oleiphilus sp. HI0079]KZZ50499.1 hypothetical protein A3758_12380 [Oleiphilus sp. HI0118]
MKLPNSLIAAAIAIIGTGLVLIASYVEPFASMNPCPMCMMQRAIYLTTAGFAILTLVSLRHRLFATIFSILGLLSAATGVAVAARQVWLQHLPKDEVPACGPPLEYMIDVFPIMEVLQSMLMGTGDCAEVQWQWLGLSIPAWSIIAFTGLAIAHLMIIVRNK